VKILSLCLILLLVIAGGLRADWQDELSPTQPGNFPALRPVTLQYQCGWSGLGAGLVQVTISHPTLTTSVLQAKASTTGLARALWRLDATHEARASLESLLPISVRQSEVYRYQTVRTELDFDDKGVEHLRESTQAKVPSPRKRFEFANLRDLQTALLYIRSQSLETGKVYSLVVYPGTTPYLATITVMGRERIKVRAGSYPAIKVDLRLEKITKEMTLLPHGKFKRATAWISDDADRLPLRMNAQIFVGSVWVELARVE
jgi:hypothetical protein